MSDIKKVFIFTVTVNRNGNCNGQGTIRKKLIKMRERLGTER